MDRKERESLVRRIISRKLYCNVKYRYDEYAVIFHDPTLDLLTEADWIYKKEYDNCLNRQDMMTIEQSIETLINNGQWSKELDKKLEGLYKDIKHLKSKLNAYKFHKAQQRIVKSTLEQGKKQIVDLESQKNQLYPSTVEYMCEIHKRNFIISKISVLQEDAQKLLKLPDFLDTLSLHYYDKNFITDGDFRELARSDPWRLYWTLSKDTGTPLFPLAVEITNAQYNLVSWTKVYDFAYASSNRPTDDIINDDDKFDAWYEDEIKRIEAENKQNSADSATGVVGQEVFIPADEEGSVEVYALNDPISRAKILQRQKTIIEKGEVKHSDLLDVKMDLKISANQQNSQEITRR